MGPLDLHAALNTDARLMLAHGPNRQQGERMIDIALTRLEDACPEVAIPPEPRIEA